MKRKVLFIPLDEIKKHFSINNRQDIKIVIHKILTDDLFNVLKEKKKDLKPEEILLPDSWTSSTNNEPNLVCESDQFLDSPLNENSSFTLAFANEKALHDEHYHTHHIEIYYPESAMIGSYRDLEDSTNQTKKLEHGGIFIFGPNVVHKMKLEGLTLVIEVPAVADDKISLS